MEGKTQIKCHSTSIKTGTAYSNEKALSVDRQHSFTLHRLSLKRPRPSYSWLCRREELLDYHF